jgi:hypothetical protein
MTPTDAPACEKPSPKPPVSLNRLTRVIRAAWMESACVAKEGGDADLVDLMQGQDNLLRRQQLCFGGTRLRCHTHTPASTTTSCCKVPLSAQRPKDLSLIVGELARLNIAARHNHNIDRLGEICPCCSKHLSDAPFDPISHNRAFL